MGDSDKNFISILSHDKPTNALGKPDVRKLGSEQDCKSEKLFIVKLQVPLMQGGPPSMMCYDKKRKLQTLITPANCAQAEQLADTVRLRGLVGGAKAYFNAYVNAENELKILFHETLPMQAW